MNRLSGSAVCAAVPGKRKFRLISAFVFDIILYVLKFDRFHDRKLLNLPKQNLWKKNWQNYCKKPFQCTARCNSQRSSPHREAPCSACAWSSRLCPPPQPPRLSVLATLNREQWIVLSRKIIIFAFSQLRALSCICHGKLDHYVLGHLKIFCWSRGN